MANCVIGGLWCIRERVFYISGLGTMSIGLLALKLIAHLQCLGHQA